MYTQVTTYRLGMSAETLSDMARCRDRGEVVSDQTARTIASWWMSPSVYSRNLTALAHGLPFDTEELLVEVEREVTDHDEREAMRAWVYALELLYDEE